MHLILCYTSNETGVIDCVVTNEINTHKVIANNYKGAFEATEHLIKSGCRRIAHFTGAPYLSVTVERLEGYKEPLAKNDIPFQDNLVSFRNHGGMIAAETEEAVTSLFALKQKPDAIF